MLVKELMSEMAELPPDARVVIYIDQDVDVHCSQWSNKVYLHYYDYFDVDEATQDIERVGAEGTKLPCLVLTAGKAVD